MKDEKETVVSITNKEKSGKETTVRIEEISNGFLIVKETYNPNAKKDNERWITTKTYSKEKPKYLGEVDYEDFKL